MQLLKKTLKRELWGRMPRKLPVTLKDFVAFSDEVFEAFDLPAEPSYRSAIATMVMHLGPTVTHKPPKYFAQSIKKAMANQVAYEVTQIAKREAEAKAKEA